MGQDSLKGIARKYGMFSSMEEYRMHLRKSSSNAGKGGGEKNGKGEKKPKKEKIYALRFNHKLVVLKLTNGEELRGKLHWSKANPYEVILETDEGEILVFKHGILYLKEEASSKARP
ncbi:MAG: RNA chaperone Hfq [Deltaproteobacteria bacterium]|nr:RNA chaperone Hfq [Deltaproteobacteria bacterium]